MNTKLKHAKGTYQGDILRLYHAILQGVEF